MVIGIEYTSQNLEVNMNKLLSLFGINTVDSILADFTKKIEHLHFLADTCEARATYLTDKASKLEHKAKNETVEALRARKVASVISRIVNGEIG